MANVKIGIIFVNHAATSYGAHRLMGLMFHWFGKFECVRLKKQQTTVGGGFDFFLLSPLPGEDSQFDEHIFSNGLKPPTRKVCLGLWDLKIPMFSSLAKMSVFFDVFFSC